MSNCVFPYLCLLKSTSLATKFSKETYLYWYEMMLLLRRFEEKTGQLYGSLLSGEFIFMVGLVYIMAWIFRRGVEIQSENDLTI